ncbi:baseplate J/gp47 family protein [Microvirga solisilvae]|uniref:baseplate J/gp47 family protein n=1 Tax=Microvirga solisilvae TaxID=2919498 RepID=UPI001FAE944B|nr:baseplate J/gp47 family protein [Microvirga solisilvae]
MTFAIPPLPDLLNRARRAFKSNLKGTDAFLWPNNIGPTAKVIAGMTHEVFGYIDYVQRQKFAITADWEGLLEHGEEFGLPPHPADAARGTLLVTGEAGFTVAAGAVFRRGDGVLFNALEGGAVLGGGTVEIPVIAQRGGKSTSTESGTSFAAVSGVDGDVSAEAATGGLVGGRDAEDVESYRARILFRKRNPPNGGKASDYVIWASAIPGVTRVFVEKGWSGGGTVRIFPLMEDTYPNGIPPADELERIAAHIRTLEPSGAISTVAAAQLLPVDVEIGDVEPLSPAVENAIVAEIREMFRRRARVAGANEPHPSMPYLATPFSFSRSWVSQAAANALDEERHTLVLPSADLTVPRGHLPVLNNISFTHGA